MIDSHFILYYFFFNEFWSRLKNKMNIEPDVVVYALDAIGSILEGPILKY